MQISNFNSARSLCHAKNSVRTVLVLGIGRCGLHCKLEAASAPRLCPEVEVVPPLLNTVPESICDFRRGKVLIVERLHENLRSLSSHFSTNSPSSIVNRITTVRYRDILPVNQTCGELWDVIQSDLWIVISKTA